MSRSRKASSECVRRYDKMEDVGLAPVLEQLAHLDPGLQRGTRQRLPEIVGGISVALADSFTIIDAKLVNPATEHWEWAFRLFNLLL